jgi:hypothetical protein
LHALDRNLPGVRLQPAQFLRLEKSWNIFRDIRAAAWNGSDDAVALQVLIGVCSGGGIDAEFSGQIADRRQGLVRLQGAGGNSVLHLGFDLRVEGHAGGRIYVEEHTV